MPVRLLADVCLSVTVPCEANRVNGVSSFTAVVSVMHSPVPRVEGVKALRDVNSLLGRKATFEVSLLEDRLASRASQGDRTCTAVRHIVKEPSLVGYPALRTATSADPYIVPVRGFHCGVLAVSILLCDAVSLGKHFPTFRWNVVPS